MTRKEAMDIIKCLAWYTRPDEEDVEQAIKTIEQEPTAKNDLEVNCIDRAELLKAMNTWDKFGYSAQYGLERLDKDDKGFVPYVKYEDMVNCVKGMPSVTTQPRKGYISIDDVMSVFDDYMRGEVDGQDTETFLEMLKDKAESEDKE